MNIHNALPTIQHVAAEAQVSGLEKSVGTSKSSLVSSASDDAHEEARLSGAASLANQAAALPDVRAEKVEAVKAAIADGSYNVSSTDLAQSLVDHMLGKE